jgi:uncharacterized membrane protein YhaH (DUF805 family)
MDEDNLTRGEQRDLDRIKRFSFRLAIAARAFFWLIVVIWAIRAVLCLTTDWVAFDDVMDRQTGLATASLLARLLAIGLQSLVVVVAVYAADQLARLLSCFARGEIFTLASTLRLRRFGLTLLVLPFVGLVVHLAIDAVIYLAVDPQHASFAIEIDAVTVLLGLVFTLLAQIMVEATRISDEFNLTI